MASTKVANYNERTSVSTDWLYITDDTGAIDGKVRQKGVKPLESLVISISDELTPLTTGTAKTTFRMQYAYTLTEVRASLSIAGTGAALVTVDINEAGASILSTKITLDAGVKTSTTAATPAVISNPTLDDDAEITVDIDLVDTDNVAAGLKIYLIGHRT